MKSIGLAVLGVLMLQMPLWANQRFVRHSEVVPGQYIVALTERAPQAIEGLARGLVRSYGGTLLDVFPTALGDF
jgi:hypothetical protein